MFVIPGRYLNETEARYQILPLVIVHETTSERKTKSRNTLANLTLLVRGQYIVERRCDKGHNSWRQKKTMRQVIGQ